MKENEKLSLVDLGKRLLEASRNGQAEVVKDLMQNGAPFTTDWVGCKSLLSIGELCQVNGSNELITVLFM